MKKGGMEIEMEIFHFAPNNHLRRSELNGGGDGVGLGPKVSFDGQEFLFQIFGLIYNYLNNYMWLWPNRKNFRRANTLEIL